MRISDILDSLKNDPTQIAIVDDSASAIHFPRALFWHPARGRFAIYELELGYREAFSLSEKLEISIVEMSGDWTLTNFNSWYDAETMRLKQTQKDREAKTATKA